MSSTVTTAALLRLARITGISHPDDVRLTDIPAQTWRHVPSEAEREWKEQRGSKK